MSKAQVSESRYREEELVEKAIASYFRKFGNDAVIPSGSASHVADGHVILVNINGELARFKIGKNGRLRYVGTGD